MPNTPNPGLLPWLWLLVLAGVPTLAGAFFRLAQFFPPIDERKARSSVFGTISVFALLIGILLWGISVFQAVLVPELFASYPREFWRWIGRVAQPLFFAGLSCGVGAHCVRAWRRALVQGKPSPR